MEERAEGYQEAKKKLYIIAKKSGSRRYLKNIKKIKAKDSKKRWDFISESSIHEEYSNDSLSKYIYWY